MKNGTATLAPSVQQQIEALKPWFHNIHLPNAEQTAPEHFLGDFPMFKWKQIEPHLPKDLTGKRILDIGCNAGFYSIELAKRGANVLAVDIDPHYLKQAKWVAEQFGLQDQIEFRQMQVYDLAKMDEQFDIVWFMGVLYHLRYPMLALDIVSRRLKGLLVFQTLTMPCDGQPEVKEDYDIHEREMFLHPSWPRMSFIEHKLNGDPTNWWVLNDTCMEAMLRSCGLQVIDKPGHEIVICTPDPARLSVLDQWNMSEYLSATGQDWQRHAETKVGNKG